MKSLFIISSFVALVWGIPESEWATNPPTLDITKPIYLASVFFPPEMNYALWTPPKNGTELDAQSPLYWCHDALDVTENISSGFRTPYFELEGLEGLKVHDFYTDRAYISRHNTRFADCVVTPESRHIGFCEGRKSEGEMFIGTGHLVWSCFVVQTDRRHVLGPRDDSTMEGMTTVESVYMGTKRTGATVRGSSNAIFTASMTRS